MLDVVLAYARAGIQMLLLWWRAHEQERDVTRFACMEKSRVDIRRVEEAGEISKDNTNVNRFQ